MNKNHLFFSLKIILIFLCFQQFCSAYEVTTSAEQAQLTDLEGKVVLDIKKNETQSIELSSPLWFRSLGKTPILMVPFKGGNNSVQVNPPTLEDSMRELEIIRANKQLSDILMRITKIQTALTSRKTQEARQLLNSLLEKHKNVPFLGFITGSVEFMEGNKDAALKSLSVAVQHHPDYEDGVNFYKKLKEASQ